MLFFQFSLFKTKFYIEILTCLNYDFTTDTNEMYKVYKYFNQ